jgi:hypothetical protein
MISARELIAWGDLDERRRRAARRGIAALPPWVSALACGAALLGEIARRLSQSDSDGGASALYVSAAAGANLIVLFGAPFRLFWRRDSSLLARLAVPGEALFRAGLVRSVRAAAAVALAMVVAAAGFAIWGSADIALRHLAIAGGGFLFAGFLGPALALAAGAIVASDKAQAVLESLGGEFRAPRTSWLGVLPGFAGAALALWATAIAPWGSGDEPVGGSGVALLAGAAVVCVIAAGWALAVAPRVGGAALREVAALDQQRLAHVDRSTPSAIERAWFSLTLRGAAHLVADKDASLLRRRYPSPYVVTALGIVICWILAFTRPQSVYVWSAAILGGLAVYAVIMARRLTLPPVEIPRLLRALPLSRAEVVWAKRSQAVLRAFMSVGVAGAPLVILAEQPLLAGAIVAVSAGVALVGGWIGAAEENP